MKDEGKRNPRIKPHDEEDDWDWKAYKNKPHEDDLDEDLDDSKQGEEDAETQGKQEQAKD